MILQVVGFQGNSMTWALTNYSKNQWIMKIKNGLPS